MSAQAYGYLSYHRVFVFELKQQSRNYRHVGNPPTCRQMLCRFGHPADTTFSCVCDMTETCRRHVADTTQNVAVWATKRHADIRHMELRLAISTIGRRCPMDLQTNVPPLHIPGVRFKK